MSKTLAVFGAGPGLGRAVAHRFGREGFRVGLIARSRERLDAFTAELRADGVDATGFVADLTDPAALTATVEAVTACLGPIDVLEYAPSGQEWITRQVAVRDADPASFEFPLELLVRVPVTLIRQVLPDMLRRGTGAVLFGLPVTASVPVPQLANIGVAAAAARSYLHNLHADLAGSGVYAGLVQVAGMVAGSDAAQYFAENWDPAALPEPLAPSRIADTLWDLYRAHDRFDAVVGAS